MATENTSLKNTTPAGDSNTTNEMVVGKVNTYQRSFLIVAGSFLALLVVIAVAGTTGSQHLQSSAHEIAQGAVALADYQVDSTNLALTKDIFGLDGRRFCTSCLWGCKQCYNCGYRPGNHGHPDEHCNPGWLPIVNGIGQGLALAGNVNLIRSNDCVLNSCCPCKHD